MAVVNGEEVDGISSDVGAGESTKSRFVVLSGNSTFLDGGSTLNYKMMQPDSGAANGYLLWVNTTGDTTGRPAPTGVLGDLAVVLTWA